MKRSDAMALAAAFALPASMAERVLAADAPAMTGSAEAAKIVAGEVAAFNAHDAATVAHMHAPDAALTLLPAGKILAKGTRELTAFFAQTFKNDPHTRITLEKQLLLKNVVVNHYATATGDGIISIYEVANGVIANEWVILG